MLNSPNYIELDSKESPKLIVVIDTEEEFDWNKKPDPKNTGVEHMQSIYKVQRIFADYGITPCYVCDYPIVSEQSSVDILKSYFDKGECEIGAHLHPWVNPPIEEEMSFSNMYPGNLGYQLEFTKLQSLTNQIKRSFNIQPNSYKAGRYGVSKNTPQIMSELGYDIDLSICTAFDYRQDGGPDFSDFEAKPYYFGVNQDSLEIPLSGAFAGWAGVMAKPLYNMAGNLNFLKARGILSRLNMVDRLMLSPEGYETAEHIKLTEFLLKQGIKTFTWNFHSPTVVPGLTMYTQSEKDVQHFLDKFKRYFDYFFNTLKGETITPIQLKQTLENNK